MGKIQEKIVHVKWVNKQYVIPFHFFNTTYYSSYYMLWLLSQFIGNILLLNFPGLLAIEHVSHELRKSKLLFMSPLQSQNCHVMHWMQSCPTARTSCLVVLYCPAHAHSSYRVIKVQRSSGNNRFYLLEMSLTRLTCSLVIMATCLRRRVI
jgi:hypothetical protein